MDFCCSNFSQHHRPVVGSLPIFSFLGTSLTALKQVCFRKGQDKYSTLCVYKSAIQREKEEEER